MAAEHATACIEACNACADACDHCAAACIAANEPDMAHCIALAIDCAALCRLAAGFMSRGSDHASDLCRLCAQICDACAAECSRHSAEHCQLCADLCRDCADECRRMSGSTSGARARTRSRAPAH